MCGIFALFNPKGMKIDRSACRTAVNLMKHRGPDAYGDWTSSDNEVFLGHRRLSIIDLSREADQPMIGADGSVLIFNGEIYNFRDIRRDLQAKGRVFRTTGDTEVLLQALEVWGTDCLTVLEGMFAFVLWSPSGEEALICRDFFGIKPLYVRQSPEGSLAVSSEIKSFCALPGYVSELETKHLPEFLRFRSLCGDSALLRGITQVEPGHIFRFNRIDRRLIRERYWNVSSVIGGESGSKNRTDLETSFLEAFTSTVQRHLIADVPVGSQFSGGVDSSLICSIAKKDLGVDLTGFHCHVPHAGYDETPYAKEAARLLGMNIEVINLSPEVFFSDLLEKLTWHHDEPLAHPNTTGIYLISELAHGKVKVLLSGESADEFFGGYSAYGVLLMKDLLRRRPLVTGFLELILNPWISKFRKGRFLANLMTQSKTHSSDDYILSGTAFMETVNLTNLLGDNEAKEKSLSNRSLVLNTVENTDILSRCQIFDILTYMPALFVRQDKMSMAASIENRVPFATPKVLSMAMALPHSERCTIFRRKSFLRRCLAHYLPRKLVNRKKVGFGLPLAQWFACKSGTERIKSLTESASPLNGVVDMSYVRKLVKDYRGENHQAEIMWILLSLQVWMNQFLKGQDSIRAD